MQTILFAFEYDRSIAFCKNWADIGLDYSSASIVGITFQVTFFNRTAANTLEDPVKILKTPAIADFINSFKNWIV